MPDTTMFHKAGEPVPLAVATAIESLRDVLFREYGTDYAFSVVARGACIGASMPGTVIEAVTRQG